MSPYPLSLFLLLVLFDYSSLRSPSLSFPPAVAAAWWCYTVGDFISPDNSAITNKAVISTGNQSNWRRPHRNRIGNCDTHPMQRSLGPQEFSPRTWHRSIQPLLHIWFTWRTDRQTPHAMTSMRSKAKRCRGESFECLPSTESPPIAAGGEAISNQWRCNCQYISVARWTGNTCNVTGNARRRR